MTESELGEALNSVLEGAVIVLLGTIIGRGAGLVTEVMVIRLFSQSQYGLFRLGVLVTMLTGAVATLGFTTGVPRQLGVDLGDEATGQIQETIGATYLLGGSVSLVMGVIVFVLSEEIASVFDTPQLAPFLRIFALAVPFFVLVDLFVAVARGVGDSRPKLYFRTFVPKFGFLAGIAAIGWFGLPFETVMVAWVASYLLAFLAAGAYGYLRLDYGPTTPSFDVSLELVVFSFPLLIVFVVNSIGSWIDTFVVGFYEPADVVGLYSATVLLSRLIPMILGSVSFMYLPIASRFYARDDNASVQLIYRTVTKWITGLTLPIFLSFMLFPGEVLTTVFGPEFRSGATVMRLLAIGFFTHTLLGTNGQSLVLIGRRRFYAGSQLASVFLNFVVSLLLIPIVGIEGAAIGSALAYIGNNIAISLYLYYVSGLNVIAMNHLVPVTGTLVVSFGLGLLLYGIKVTFVVVAVFAVSVGLIHIVVYVKTSSINTAELEMIQNISDFTGLPLYRLVRMLE